LYVYLDAAPLELDNQSGQGCYKYAGPPDLGVGGLRAIFEQITGTLCRIFSSHAARSSGVKKKLICLPIIFTNMSVLRTLVSTGDIDVAFAKECCGHTVCFLLESVFQRNYTRYILIRFFPVNRYFAIPSDFTTLDPSNTIMESPALGTKKPKRKGKSPLAAAFRSNSRP
jgi:hypothetical protein